MKSLLPVIVALGIGLCGCASMAPFEDEPVPEFYKQEYHSGNIPRNAFETGGVALGGIVVRDGVEVHRHPDLPSVQEQFGHRDQTEIWSSTFAWKFAQRFSAPSLIKFGQFDEYVPDDVLDTMWNEYAQGGNINPDILDAVRSANPDIQFAIMVRIEYDRIAHDIDTAWLIGNQAANTLQDGGSAHDPTRTNDSLSPTLQRKVGVTMDLIDLQTGRVVWEGRALKDVHTSVDPGSLDDYDGFQAKEIHSGQYSVVESEEHPNAPPFYKVLEKCLGDLFKDMNKRINDKT